MKIGFRELVENTRGRRAWSWTMTFDGFVKSQKTDFFVIPAKAGIQFSQLVASHLDSGFHRSDDFL